MEDLRDKIEAILDDCGVKESLGKIRAIRELHDLMADKESGAQLPCSDVSGTIADLRELLRDIKKWDIERSGEHLMKTGQAMQMLLPECLRKRIQKAVMSD
jgi:hypothetical protein